MARWIVVALLLAGCTSLRLGDPENTTLYRDSAGNVTACSPGSECERRARAAGLDCFGEIFDTIWPGPLRYTARCPK